MPHTGQNCVTSAVTITYTRNAANIIANAVIIAIVRNNTKNDNTAGSTANIRKASPNLLQFRPVASYCSPFLRTALCFTFLRSFRVTLVVTQIPFVAS